MRRRRAPAMARIGVALDLEAKVADLSVANRQLVAICRAHGGRRAPRHHGRADRRRSPATRSRRSCRSSRELKAKGISDHVRLAPPQRGAGSRRARHRAARRPQGRHLRGRRDGRQEARRADDRQELPLRPEGDPARAGCRSRCRSRTSRGAANTRTSRFEVHAGEILGITGPARLRPHRAGAVAVRHDAARFGHDPRRRPAPSTFRTPREAIDHGIAYVPEDRLTLGLVLDQPIGANIVVTVLDKLAGPLGLIEPRDASADGRTSGSATCHQGLRSRESGEDAVGRQPAARGARQMDGAAAARAHPRQPHRRRRRQRQGRHLRDRQAAGRRRGSPSS